MPSWKPLLLLAHTQSAEFLKLCAPAIARRMFRCLRVHTVGFHQVTHEIVRKVSSGARPEMFIALRLLDQDPVYQFRV